MNRKSTSNNMTKYSLRSWVLVLALAPTILVGILLGGYFTINRFYELEDSLLEQGKNFIEPLAIASEISLVDNNREATKRLLASAQLHRSSLVKSIAIFDNKNQLFVTSHSHRNLEELMLATPLTELHNTEFEHVGDKLILRSPIYTTLSLSPNMDLNSRQARLGYIAMVINKERALLEQHRAAVAAFIIVLIGVQLNLLFTFRLVKNVTQPISDMVRVVAKIREGKLDTRLKGNLIGELDLLKRGINDMASSLSEYHDEMQQNIDQATSDLRETLEQIEIQNVELDLAKKRALEASRIKSEFLANMSHELRTPLNGVIGFARQLIKTPLHESQLDYIKTIERSATNLLSIINDILDFSKLEAGKMVLENISFSLRDNIDDALSLMSASAYEKQLELIVDIAPEIPDHLSGDAIRVNQVITNLVGNAIKFTDSGSIQLKIEKISATHDQIILRGEVKDTGIGIDKSHQEVLFQAFGQADSSISRRFGGTGLGLIITKRLLNQMGGKIGFSSVMGQGSTFWFTLPINISNFPLAGPVVVDELASKTVIVYEPKLLSRNLITAQLSRLKLEITAIETPEQLHTELANNQQYDFAIMSCNKQRDGQQLSRQLQRLAKKSKVLLAICDFHDHNYQHQYVHPHCNGVLNAPVAENSLIRMMLMPAAKPKLNNQVTEAAPIARLTLNALAVDDNPANLKLIDTLLKESVTNVTSVNSGEQAIEQARQHHFDIIFMDIQMPGVDGISATQQIRQDSLNRHTPIIAVTAHALAEEREKISRSGMDDYLPKPIIENDLKNMLNHWVSKPQFTHFDPRTLNWGLCLQQANNKTDLAIEMLQMLIDSIPATTEEIELALDQQDKTNMQRIIHKLHGASCYCGVPATQQLCQAIESNLKHNLSVAELEPEILELLDELTKVESAATQLISQLSTDLLDDQETRIF
ncbi:two-component sensor histidine kinase BarA [Shewanella marina]|uniref:two-component sensor histidine kinase BarA n=1 Tax=Shewanella marina TaxID=487319 RepID=UPI000471954C|nr:two-component sensor histidine kinase BarA [Shewanella marina]